jgi:hypothetical protein
MRTTVSLIPRTGHAISLLLLAMNRTIAETMLGDIDPACSLETQADTSLTACHAWKENNLFDSP